MNKWSVPPGAQCAIVIGHGGGGGGPRGVTGVQGSTGPQGPTGPQGAGGSGASSPYFGGGVTGSAGPEPVWRKMELHLLDNEELVDSLRTTYGKAHDAIKAEVLRRLESFPLPAEVVARKIHED